MFKQKLTSASALIFQTPLKLLAKLLQVYSFFDCWIIFFKGRFEGLLFNVSLNNFIKISEQLCPLDFKTLDGMF